MGILDAGVAAKSTIGRIDVGGIASEKDAPVLLAYSYIGEGAPGRDVVNLDRYFRNADGRANQSNAPLCHVPGRIDDEEPGVAFILQPEESAQHGVKDVDHAQVAPP